MLQLRESNAALEERVRQLERQASRNSGNSSMRPSSDDLPGRAKPTHSRELWAARFDGVSCAGQRHDAVHPFRLGFHGCCTLLEHGTPTVRQRP